MGCAREKYRTCSMRDARADPRPDGIRGPGGSRPDAIRSQAGSAAGRDRGRRGPGAESGSAPGEPGVERCSAPCATGGRVGLIDRSDEKRPWKDDRHDGRPDEGHAMRDGHTQVTIIGGGSYQWAPKLITDLLGHALAERACTSCSRTSTQPRSRRWRRSPASPTTSSGPRPRCSTTTDQRRALEGADFVVVTISTGGFRAMAVDIDVPARHGIKPVGGRQCRPRRHQPGAAQHPDAGRHRARHGGGSAPTPGCSTSPTP